MVITSQIDGRVRVRDPRLRQPQVLERVRQNLILRPEVREVSSNPKVGSLLILYRQGRQVLQKITQFLKKLLGLDLPSATPARSAVRSNFPAARPLVSRRRMVNLGMLAALLVSMLAMAASKQLHIIAGLHFLGFLTLHLFDKRRTLLT